MTIQVAAAPPVPVPAREDPRSALREAAIGLEASFISTLLKESGFGKIGAFGGGAGEEQFVSFLRDLHAREIAEAGGIGLAENIFRSLEARSGG